MSQRFTILRLATALALGAMIGAGTALVTGAGAVDRPMGMTHTQMMSRQPESMMTGEMMTGGMVTGGMMTGGLAIGPHGRMGAVTGSDEHHHRAGSITPD